MRIVSLVPSATEIVFAIGRGPQVVGRTHECDHPEEVAAIPPITEDALPRHLPSSAIDAAVARGVRDAHTIYRLDGDLLRRLRPDVVVTQSLCPVCAVPTSRVEDELCSMPAAALVAACDPKTLEEVLSSISAIGDSVGAAPEAHRLAAGLRLRLDRLAEVLGPVIRPRVAVIEWPDPLYAPGHWVPEMVDAAGGESVFGSVGQPSRRAEFDELAGAEADVIVLAFCGFNLYETQARLRELAQHPGWTAVGRSSRILAVDGSAYFSRPGPRLIDGIELLAWGLHRSHPALRPQTGRIAELIELGWIDLASLPPVTAEAG